MTKKQKIKELNLKIDSLNKDNQKLYDRIHSLENVNETLSKLLNTEIQNKTYIADAIKNGLSSLPEYNNSISLCGTKIATKSDMDDISYRITNLENDNKEMMASAYDLVIRLEKYKNRPYKEIKNKDIDDIDINPFKLSLEKINNINENITKILENQKIFNDGYNYAITKKAVNKR